MKILIFTKNWLGDVLFQTPAIEAIRNHYPEAEIVCVAPSRCREILTAHPAVNRVIVFDEKKEHRFFISRFVFGLRLRNEKWDQAYLFHRSRTRALIAALAGAKERFGYGSGRQAFLTKAVAEPKTQMHQVDYFLHLLREAGIPSPAKAAYRFHFSEKAKTSARKMLEQNGLKAGSFVAFHLGANWEPKRWPSARFARLADLITERWQVGIVVTGSIEDLPLVDEMIKRVQRATVISLVGKTDLEELGAIYQAALCVVTGDSGPMHIASGVGTPVVALFGPTDPSLTGPRGTGDKVILQYVPHGYQIPWYGKNLPKEGWLSNIQPEEVIKAIEEKGWVKVRNRGDRRPETGETVSRLLSPSKNILLITLSNIGDVIMTTPVITALAAKFPAAKLTVVVGPRAQGVLAGSRFIHELVIYDKKAGLKEQWRFLRKLQRQVYDWAIDLRHTAIPYLVRARKRGPLFRRFREMNMRQRHLEVLKMLGFEPHEIPPFDFFRPSDEASLLQKLKARGIAAEKDWILVAPAAASELKTWRLAGFQEVSRWLLEEQTGDILLVGDRRERQIAEPLVKIDSSRIHNLAGETTLPELAVLVSRSSLLLANDSAVMHLGYELNRPVVAIFGPTDYGKYGHTGPKFKIVREPVFCSPCEQPRCRFQRQSCFEDLKPEKVFEACQELLIQANASVFQ